MSDLDDAAIDDQDSDNAEEVAHCPQCLTPFEEGQYYCSGCGYGVGNLTPYIAFVNLPFYCRFFRDAWRMVWFNPLVSIAKRIVCLVLIGLFEPIMFLGLPFVARHQPWR